MSKDQAINMLIKQTSLALGYTSDPSRENDDMWGYRAVKDGTSLFFRHKPNTKQIQITGNVDRSNEVYISNGNRDELTLAINVSTSKCYQQVVKDVERRLIPSIKSYKTIVDAKLAVTDEYKKNVEDNIALADSIIGSSKGFRADTDTTSFTSDTFYGSIQMSSDTCQITLRSLPISVMEEVLKVLAKHKDSK